MCFAFIDLDFGRLTFFWHSLHPGSATQKRTELTVLHGISDIKIVTNIQRAVHDYKTHVLVQFAVIGT